MNASFPLPARPAAGSSRVDRAAIDSELRRILSSETFIRSERMKRFLEFTNDAPLDSEVGVVYVEVAQPIEKQPLEAAMVCAGLLKRPVWREQHSDVTARVAAFSRVAAR